MIVALSCIFMFSASASETLPGAEKIFETTNVEHQHSIVDNKDKPKRCKEHQGEDKPKCCKEHQEEE